VTEGDITEDEVTKSARALGRRCLAKRVVVATAESCTGGGVATAITRVSGSAKWFDRAFVTYSNDAKREMLGVRALTLRRHGAVSEEVAREMAQGRAAPQPRRPHRGHYRNRGADGRLAVEAGGAPSGSPGRRAANSSRPATSASPATASPFACSP
jgi:hypothetical protein